MDWLSQLKHLDSQLREGNFTEVQETISATKVTTIPREHSRKFAELARRSGLGSIALAVLHPIVRGELKDPSAKEIVEYATNLSDIGSGTEALSLFEKVDEKEAPEALFYKTFVYTSQWQYENCIEPLERYINTPNIDPYFRQVALINLCDAYVYLREHVKVRPLLSELLHDTHLSKLSRLLANTLQIAAVDAFRQKDWKLANGFLDRAEQQLKGAHLDTFFVEKWRCVIEAYRDDDLTPLESFRRKAIEMGHWETVRDCDRFIALKKDSQSLLLKVYFGTPYPGYRSWLLKDWGKPLSLPQSYPWSFEKDSNWEMATDPIDDKTGLNDLKPGYVQHRLLKRLSSDFYQTQRLGSLFFELFPEEHFDPHSSPKRVHEAVRRLRQWLSKKESPIELVQKESSYRLKLNSAKLWVSLGGQSFHGKYQEKLRLLKSTFKNAPFATSEAASILKKSNREVRRLLNDSLDQGLVREGEGSNTRYRFKA